MKNFLSVKEKYIQNDFIWTRKIYHSATVASISSFVGVLALAIFALCHFCFFDITVTEIYTNKIFYYINFPLRKILQFIPFSVSELLLYIFIVCSIVLISKTIFHTVKSITLYIRMNKEGYLPERRSMLRPIAHLGLRFVSVFCVCVAVFIFFGGINYTGSTIAQNQNHSQDGYTVKQLRELCYILAEEVSITRQVLETNPNGSIDENHSEYNPYKLAEEAKIAYNRLPEEYGITHKDSSIVKFAYSSEIMSNFHITGIYPYLLPEAIVNINTPIMSLPHTICHEMAHQQGFAREDEANFIAYMACLQSDNPLFAYSAYYTAFSYAMNELRLYDTESWNNIMEHVDKNVLKDMDFENTYWNQFQTVSSEFTSSVNDTYLSIMTIEDGVKNYGRMLELLLEEAIRSGAIK